MNRTFSVAIMVASVVLTFQSSFAAELEPRKADTLWTRSTDQIPGVFEFKGCAMGGNPRVLMTGTFGGDLIAFDAMTGDTLRHVKSQLGSIYNISFARNANVFSTTSPYTVKIWRWPEMEVINEISFPEQAGNSKRHVQATLTSDGRRIIIGAYSFPGSKTGLFDVESGEVIHEFGASPTLEPKISVDDRIALVYTNNPQVYDLTTGKWLATLPSGGNGATSMDISEDGRYVAVSSEGEWEVDGSVVIYDIEQKRELGRRYFDWRESRVGNLVELVPGTSGFLIFRVKGNDGFFDFYPNIEGEPTLTYSMKHFGVKRAPQNGVRYGTGVDIAYVSRVNLTTSSELDNERSAEPLVSPNPSTGALTVSGLDVTDGPVTWTIADITGTQISDGITTISSGSCLLDPGALTHGTYFLRLRREDRILFVQQIQR